jgi:Nucleotidyl transferase AbiEii toxin, Type IV TA system
MDFERVLDQVGGFVKGEGARFAVVGGLALQAYGLVRPTFDLDLITEGKIQPALVEHLESLGYETLHRSAGFSNHLNTSAELGRLDVIYVRGQSADEIFGAATAKPFATGVTAPTPRPEHLIALKLHGMANDSTRRYQDLADIRYLLTLDALDRDLARSYFERYGRKEIWDELQAAP